MSWSKPLIRILTLRCEEASLLSSRELDEPLTFSERIALRGHRLICRSCHRFARQIGLLHQALRERPTDRSSTSPELDGLSPESRQRIADVIREAGADGFSPRHPQ